MDLGRDLFQNRLLSLCPDPGFAAISANLHPVELPQGFVVADVDQTVEHYYFPETCLGSIVSISPEGHRTEVGIVGRDGVTPVAAILRSDTSAHYITIQAPGTAWRIEADALVQALAEHPDVHSLFLRFMQTLWTQSTYTALSNAVHHVEERLARWLLMCDDRTGGNKIALTHDFLSIMLAVRRPSVTTALHVLEGNKLIVSTRGMLEIRDREALEAFAGDAYGIPEREYERLIGPMAPGQRTRSIASVR